METDKLTKANDVIKAYLTKHFEKDSYVYTDFVTEDRFLHEIKADKNISISGSTAEELADYAIEQIENSASRSRLIGF